MSDQNPYSSPDPHNPYGQTQPGYGYPQGGQPAYGHPQGGQPAYGHPQAPYPGAMGGYPTGDPSAPYGYDYLGRPFSDKSKVTAGVLQLLLGIFGVGRFYTGHVGQAIAQLLTCGGFGIWALIDGILLLVQDDQTDAQGRILRG